MKILLVSDESKGWHLAQVQRACNRHAITCVRSPLSSCRVDFTRSWGLMIPGFQNRPPAGVLVRSISAGSLQRITLRLDFLHHMHNLGVPVVNPPRGIEQCVDKAMTSLRLRQAGVPTPPTWVTEDEHRARAIVLRETNLGHDILYKPLFGSQGKGIVRLTHGSTLPEPQGGVFYLQRYMTPHADAKKNWWDWRVLVLGDRVIARMKRHGTSWLNNVAQGSRCEIGTGADRELETMALMATRSTGVHFAGVDIIEDGKGRRLVLEVNSMPSWHAIQGLCSFNIAEILLDDLRDRITRSAQLANP